MRRKKTALLIFLLLLISAGIVAGTGSSYVYRMVYHRRVRLPDYRTFKLETAEDVEGREELEGLVELEEAEGPQHTPKGFRDYFKGVVKMVEDIAEDWGRYVGHSVEVEEERMRREEERRRGFAD